LFSFIKLRIEISILILKLRHMKKSLLLILLTVFFAGNLMAQLSFEDAQILHVSFDDEADLSYTDYDFVLTEEVGLTADEGIFGGAAYFDGEGSWIVYEPLEGFNHGMEWTWSFWLKTESTEDFWGIMSFGTYSGDPLTDWYDEEPRVGGLFLSSYEGIFNVEISWIGWVGDDGTLDPVPWNDGEWHHVVISHSAEAETMRIYVDNALAGQEEEPISIAADLEVIKAEEGFTEASLEDDHIKLGFAGQGWFDEEEEKFPDIMFYEGFMDDFRLFDVALTPEQVQELFEYAPTGIGDLPDANALRIYPNPASEYIVIDSRGQEVEVGIYNVAGQMVMSSVNESRLDISSLPRGFYFVNASVDGEISVQKLLVE
jgi:hypothetical protein